MFDKPYLIRLHNGYMLGIMCHSQKRKQKLREVSRSSEGTQLGGGGSKVEVEF